MKTIAFLLPSHVRQPSGGVKVVFEYANFLAGRGWHVTIVQPAIPSFSRVSWFLRVKSVLRYPWIFLSRRYRPGWIKANPGIRMWVVPSLNQHFVPKSDVYVATAVETAEQLMEYDITANKAYLIQDYENWDVSEDRLLATYRSNMMKFVVSHWLYDRVARLSPNPVTFIPNGFDFDAFGCDVPIEKRDPNAVAFMYHVRPSKDVSTGLRALELVHEKNPRLIVNMFGVYPKGSEVPEWIHYTQNPTQQQLRAIYNNAAIYLAASRDEGWGLTVGEAMICGCAVCCTDCAGFKEMVEDGVTGLLAKIGNPIEMSANLLSLQKDFVKRVELAKSAMERIAKHHWETSKVTFERVLPEGK